jgi:hypothetical protein
MRPRLGCCFDVRLRNLFQPARNCLSVFKGLALQGRLKPNSRRSREAACLFFIDIHRRR